MARALALLAAAAVAAVVLMTDSTGGPAIGESDGFTQSDIQDLRNLNSTDLGGFQAGTRAGMVETQPDDQTGTVGL